jgi:hypothetical protein
MEEKIGPLEKSKLSKLRNHAEFQRICEHILSPLEREAFENDYQGFTYEVDGKQITIDPGYGKALIDMFVLKIEIFNDVLKQIDYSVLGNITKMITFLSQEIESTNLPVYLANKLRAAGYEYLYDVYRAGKEKLMLTPGIGKKGLKAIEALLEEGGWGLLFS